MSSTESRYIEIGFRKKKVVIGTEQIINKERDETEKSEFSSMDEPMDSFVDSLQAFVADVIQICELPDDYAQDMNVSRLSFNYTSDGIMGACIIASKKLEDTNAGYVNLTTPNCPQYPTNDYSTWCMSAEMGARIAVLQEEATKYMAGERKINQQELPGLAEARTAATKVQTKAAKNLVDAMAAAGGGEIRDGKGGVILSIASKQLKDKGF